ncbi:putative folate metabolism gamma-glutamate ligase [Candidatus Parcubacteria bacterium]|nr:MAG: putative folate metabolism gamma-glutamate ligase [Candidatus Parcubacteria bacterium]
MKFIPIRTRPLRPPKDDLLDVLTHSLPAMREGDILFITSKVVAIHQGRCVSIASAGMRDALIRREADRLIPKKTKIGNLFLTIKGNTLIPSSGIDLSNGGGYTVLWPRNPYAAAAQIRRWLMKKFRVRNIGVVITDSHTIPLRYGVVGISIGFAGFQPLYDYRGKPDIFQRKLKYTKTNIVDALSAMAVLLMGEGNEQTPLVILRNAPFIRFTPRRMRTALVIEPERDLYYPLLKIFRRRPS